MLDTDIPDYSFSYVGGIDEWFLEGYDLPRPQAGFFYGLCVHLVCSGEPPTPTGDVIMRVRAYYPADVPTNYFLFERRIIVRRDGTIVSKGWNINPNHKWCKYVNLPDATYEAPIGQII
jgi:hypothetical protein